MGRRIVVAVLGLLVVLALAFVLGPRVPVDTTIRFDPKGKRCALFPGKPLTLFLELL